MSEEPFDLEAYNAIMAEQKKKAAKETVRVIDLFVDEANSAKEKLQAIIDITPEGPAKDHMMLAIAHMPLALTNLANDKRSAEALITPAEAAPTEDPVAPQA